MSPSVLVQPDALSAFGGRRVAGFLLKCAVIYGVLVAAWPGVGDAYASYLRGMGNLLFGSWGSRGRVEFRAALSSAPNWDTLVIQSNLERGKSGQGYQDSRRMGYLPTAALTALVLATPMPWARRWRALGWGVVLVNLFIAFRIFLSIIVDFCGDQAFALYVVSPSLNFVLQQTMRVFDFAPAIYFVGPMFIWLLVTFRRKDWDQLFGPWPRRG